MATTPGSRKSTSIHDYPEHLNPFREDKTKFWTIGRKLTRSNSINFSGIKDLKNSWAFKSFMKKGKKEKQTPPKAKNDAEDSKESSPVVFRRAMMYSSMSLRARNTVQLSPSDRYVYGGSVTPLPRSRFQERLRSPSQCEVSAHSVTPLMRRSEVSGSRQSVESTNPFEEGPVPPVRASRRKKKRVAPSPPGGIADVSIGSTNSEYQTSELDDSKCSSNDGDLELGTMNLNIELKIVEDKDLNGEKSDITDERGSTQSFKNTETDIHVVNKLPSSPNTVTDIAVAPDDMSSSPNSESEEKESKQGDTEKYTKIIPQNGDISTEMFPKVDIVRYRRNSSLNEDDIRLCRDNLEDLPSYTKRSKSLTNSLDTNCVTFDDHRNENTTKDKSSDNEPKKVICKLYEERKQSTDKSVSSAEKELHEIDRATRELEKEINKLNSALATDDEIAETRLSVLEIKQKFDRCEVGSPNPIPKPRRHNSRSANGQIE